MTEADRLVKMRIKSMVFAASAFALWQLSWLASDILASSHSTFLKVAQIGTVFGALAWAGASLFYARFSSQAKKAAVCAQLNDELTCHNRAQALGLGYAILMFGIVLLIAISSLTQWNLLHGLKFVGISGVIIPILVFARLEYNNDLGAE